MWFQPGRAIRQLHLLASALLLLLASSALASEPNSWQGTWVTDLGVMELGQTDQKVTGAYGGNGTVEGAIEGNNLYGTYRAANADGELEWTLAADGRSFTGKWVRGGQRGVWRGWRKDPVAEDGPVADFAGVWLTSFGTLQLTEEGDKVTGRYGAEGWATVEGTVVGRRLQLNWRRLQWSGTAWLEQTTDGQRIFGATEAAASQVWIGLRLEDYPLHAAAKPGQMVNGRAKNGMLYHLRMPDDWRPGQPVDVVVLLHGSNWTTRGMVPVTATNWPEVGKRFAILGIEGENWASWSDPRDPRFNYAYVNWMGRSTYKGFPYTERESPYLVMQLLEELGGEYSFGRLLVGGHSQGAFLTYLLHMHYPDKLAGTFPMSGGLVMQAEPDVFDDAELRAAQRATPMAIVHGRLDNVVPFTRGAYAYGRLRIHDFARAIFFTPEAGHPYDFLSVGDAIEYLDAMSTTDEGRLVTYTKQQAEVENWRAVGSLLSRAAQVGDAKEQLKDTVAAYERMAAGKAESLRQAIEDNQDGSWVAEYHKWAEQFALSQAGAETMAAFAALREEHRAPAKKLGDEAAAALRSGDQPTAEAKYEEIVQKYYAAPEYTFIKN